MCMMDLWIARHTIVRYAGAAIPTVLRADPNRIGIIVVDTHIIQAADEKGNVFWRSLGGTTPVAFTTSVTTAVPPGVDTGTIAPATSYDMSRTAVLSVTEFGSVIQGQVTITATTLTNRCWEVLADTVLAQKLADLDKLEGWPLFGSPR